MPAPTSGYTARRVHYQASVRDGAGNIVAGANFTIEFEGAGEPDELDAAGLAAAEAFVGSLHVVHPTRTPHIYRNYEGTTVEEQLLP